MKRKQLIYTEERKWEYGTILIEDGICLIENGEGDILLADTLQHSPIWVHHKGKWEQAGFQDQLVLACGEENISLSGENASAMRNQSSGRSWRFWIRLTTKPFSHFCSTCTASAYRYSIASFLIIKESFRILRRGRVCPFITFQMTPPNARCSITTATKGQETVLNGRLQTESDPLCIQQSNGGANKKAVHRAPLFGYFSTTTFASLLSFLSVSAAVTYSTVPAFCFLIFTENVPFASALAEAMTFFDLFFTLIIALLFAFPFTAVSFVFTAFTFGVPEGFPLTTTTLYDVFASPFVAFTYST